jgi:hypothetical protein
VDQLFEEGKTVPVSGYIGRKPSYYDAAKDFYKPEPTAARERYQLEPMMISHGNRNVLSSLFYEDLIANLARPVRWSTTPTACSARATTRGHRPSTSTAS